MDPHLKALYARHGIKPPKRARAQPEAVLQASVADYLDRVLDPAQVFWSSTLNGVVVYAGMRARLKRQGLRPGVPDLVFVALQGASRGHTWWIELKADAGRLTKEQAIVMEALRCDPQVRGAVCRSLPQVEDALINFGFDLRFRL